MPKRMKLHKKKIMVVFGTRPEAIKLAPVIKEMNRYNDKLKPVICVTAQHRRLLDQVLDIFKIKPQYDLNIMEANQSLFKVLSKGIYKLRDVILKVRPDLVLVQGDTTTTFLASLAAFYFKIPVGHVEAGLRTNDKYNPFPEEINRRITSAIADIYFAPTREARYNILKEGVDRRKIFITGNTGIDTLFAVKAAGFASLKNLNSTDDKKLILVTAHRREKFGRPFVEFCYALRDIVKKNKDVSLIYAYHPNPNVRKVVRKVLDGVERVSLIKPLGYVKFVQLMNQAYLIITDSGGIQEEAPSLGKPVVVVRNITERPEAVRAGSAKIAGEQRGKIVKIVDQILNNKKTYRKMSVKRHLYGDGKAAYRIVKLILHYFKMSNKPKEFIPI